MELQISKRYPVAASVEQAWAVLGDLRATAACMPGAEITEQLDDTHFKGLVRTRVGPASLSFQGEITLQRLDPAGQCIALQAKGSDKSGSAASMQLQAALEADGDAGCTLVGQASISVSGKLAQIGNRLLQPASDALLAQFAKNFETRAAAVVREAAAPQALADAAPPTPAAAAPAPAPAAELNALALLWTMLRNWLNGLRKR